MSILGRSVVPERRKRYRSGVSLAIRRRAGSARRCVPPRIACATFPVLNSSLARSSHICDCCLCLPLLPACTTAMSMTCTLFTPFTLTVLIALMGYETVHEHFLPSLRSHSTFEGQSAGRKGARCLPSSSFSVGHIVLSIRLRTLLLERGRRSHRDRFGGP